MAKEETQKSKIELLIELLVEKEVIKQSEAKTIYMDGE